MLWGIAASVGSLSPAAAAAAGLGLGCSHSRLLAVSSRPDSTSRWRRIDQKEEVPARPSPSIIPNESSTSHASARRCRTPLRRADVVACRHRCGRAARPRQRLRSRSLRRLRCNAPRLLASSRSSLGSAVLHVHVKPHVAGHYHGASLEQGFRCPSAASSLLPLQRTLLHDELGKARHEQAPRSEGPTTSINSSNSIPSWSLLVYIPARWHCSRSHGKDSTSPASAYSA